jgi:hypothetical protein
VSVVTCIAMIVRIECSVRLCIGVMHDEDKTCIKERNGVTKELPKSNDLEAIVTNGDEGKTGTTKVISQQI